MKASTWLKHRDRGSIFMIGLGKWGALTLGRRVMRWVLWPITLYFFLFTRRGKRASQQFLARALPQKPAWYHTFKHYYVFATSILDRAYLYTDHYTKLKVTLHQSELVANILQQQRGCLLLGSHLGCFDVLRAVVMQSGDLPLKVMMNTHISQNVYRFIHQLNPAIEDTIIQVGDLNSYLQVSEALAQGYMVGLLGDRTYPGERTVLCDFLGKKAAFSLHPYLLASMTNVPIVLCFGLYLGGNRYACYFELLAEEVRCERPDREAKAAQYAARYAQRLEEYAQKFPYNWFNFYDFWHIT